MAHQMPLAGAIHHITITHVDHECRLPSALTAQKMKSLPLSEAVMTSNN